MGIKEETPCIMKCKCCASDKVMYWKDFAGRFPDFWECKDCGKLFNANMTECVSIEQLPEDIKENLKKAR